MPDRGARREREGAERNDSEEKHNSGGMSWVLESKADLNSIGFDEIGRTLLSTLSEMFIDRQKTNRIAETIERFCTVIEAKKKDPQKSLCCSFLIGKTSMCLQDKNVIKYI